MRYTEICISLNPFNEQLVEILIAKLAEIGYDSFSETNEGFLGYIPEKVFDLNRTELLVKEFLLGNYKYELTHQIFEDKNWNELWE